MTEQQLLDHIREMAAVNDGVAYSTRTTSAVRMTAQKFFGSWLKACEAAGVLCPSSMECRKQHEPKKERDKDFFSRTKNGVDVERIVTSKCMDCGTVGCTWEHELVMPKGVIFKTKIINDEGYKRAAIVIYCPYFTPFRKKV